MTTASTRANASHQSFQDSPALQQFVIGKIDAGIAVLISDSVHLIEFPSLLLPTGVGPGSIVNIACTRNLAAERNHARTFWDLQDQIAHEFGAREPEPPKLRIRNTTQTSVTLEWDPLDLASADLVNLSIYRNNQRLTTIPNPKSNTSTKLSGLQLDTDYAFHLVLKTTAGQYSSPVVRTRTHTIDNTTGISVCFGLVEPPQLLANAQQAVEHLGAKADDKIQIDTTHFVATSSAARSNPNGPPGPEYQKATQLSIPVVTPEWLLACSQAKKLVPISAYYLGQTNRAASLSSAQLVSSSSTSTSPASANQRTASDSTGAAQPLSQVREEENEVVRPPVELEENVEAPPTEQTIAVQAEAEAEAAVAAAATQETAPSVSDVSALADKADRAPEPVEPVVVKSSEDGPAEDDNDDESSTRGIKSSEEGESQAEAAAAESQEQEEKEEAVEPVAAAADEPEQEPEPASPPPTISVTPPVEEAPEPEPTTAVTESSSDAATRQEDEAPSVAAVELEKEQTAEPEHAAGVETAEAATTEDQEAGETSLVDIKL